jgi:hypothetical protein
MVRADAQDYSVKPLTQQGIDAFKAGNLAEARHFLKQALQQDHDDIDAWLYLSMAVEKDADKAFCLQNVLRLDPGNKTAQRGLDEITQAKNRQSATPPSSPPQKPPASPAQPPAQSYTPPFVMYNEEELEEFHPPAPKFEPKAKPTDPSIPEVPPGAESPATFFREALIQDPSGRPDEARPASPQKKSSHASKKKTSFQPWMWAVLIGMIVLIIIVILVFILIALNQRPSTPAAAATLAPTQGQPISMVDDTSTQTPIPTATYMVLGTTIVKQMSNIQQQVSDLRGLPIQNDVPSYIVSKSQAEDLLRNLFITDDTRQDLENEKRSLVILGLVKPTYDLVNMALNHIVDNIGGFYLPDQKQMYVLAALRFGGIEHWVYSHEFDHAIVDQKYNIAVMQDCPGDDQRCEAVKALIEGDATLLMGQWVGQYATPQDYRDFLSYRPPAMALPEEFPPPYLVEDTNFPYNQGAVFVQTLYKRGNWAAVDSAYANLPSSTEQILHPEKYLAGEGPLPVSAPDIQGALGSDWQEIESNTLGEWTTYLLLTSGADNAAQIEIAEAEHAAAGWGGDHYQVYYTPSLNKTALAAHWVWDSEKDGEEFNTALKKHLQEMYRGNTKEQPGADCWEVTDQITCAFSKPGQTLWLTAPDLATLTILWGQYPEFQ